MVGVGGIALRWQTLTVGPGSAAPGLSTRAASALCARGRRNSRPTGRRSRSRAGSIDLPRIRHAGVAETIYLSLFVQSRGVLRKRSYGTSGVRRPCVAPSMRRRLVTPWQILMPSRSASATEYRRPRGTRPLGGDLLAGNPTLTSRPCRAAVALRDAGAFPGKDSIAS